VIESDKILVMEKGVLMEFEEPSKLLADTNSMFSKLVDKTGVEGAKALRKAAAEYFASKEAQRAGDKAYAQQHYR
jgi:hypothetical protein